MGDNVEGRISCKERKPLRAAILMQVWSKQAASLGLVNFVHMAACASTVQLL